MDSFFSLFDPNSCNDCSNDDFAIDNMNNQNSLPPEPQVGNVEYKLKIVNPTKQRFEHLVTQLKWRLREGNGEAIYEIGVEDSGILAGLSKRDMAASLQTLQQMAIKLGATTTILRERVLDNGRSIAEVLVRKVPDDQNNIEIRVAVLGNADAGKSTLLGVLTQGSLDNGRGRARLNMFRHLHEIQSGRTSSISHEILGFNSQISSTAGAVGMAYEHLAIAVALNVPFFIVITKIDLVQPTTTLQSLESFLKQVGSRRVPLIIKNLDDVITAGANQLTENVVPIFCVSSVNGEGLDLLSRFLHVLPPGISSKEKERLEQESPEFHIDENFKAGDVGQILGGLLTKGVITEGAKMQIGPMKNGSFQNVTVKSIHRNRVPCRMVRAGQSAAVCLDSYIPGLRNGMVLLSLEENAKGCLFFQASVSVLFHATAIYPGFQTTVHIGNIRQTAVVIGICSSKCIHTNERDSVLFKFKLHPEYVTVGQRLLFREGAAKGIGEITQIFPLTLPP
ncbi:hypothetical protein NQ314_016763 [Rhamnusium bicolor]|uniref:GTP-binding protein 2 n=1 Tax=Rhamnusium bicolor TaxID=1586634 RepID=A0AAV8WV35_9CUCU|nr:hypothetical protein NQ314_016763 [Rhamnusium bicolor]